MQRVQRELQQLKRRARWQAATTLRNIKKGALQEIVLGLWHLSKGDKQIVRRFLLQHGAISTEESVDDVADWARAETEKRDAAGASVPSITSKSADVLAFRKAEVFWNELNLHSWVRTQNEDKGVAP